MKSAADKIKPGRQLEILQLLAAGHERKEICERLDLHRATVNNYIDRLYKRLGASSPAQALALYLKQKHPRLDLF